MSGEKSGSSHVWIAEFKWNIGEPQISWNLEWVIVIHDLWKFWAGTVSFQQTPENRPPSFHHFNCAEGVFKLRILPWTSKSQRNRRDDASHQRSGQAEHGWKEILVCPLKPYYTCPEFSFQSIFPPFYSSFIQCCPGITFHCKTQKLKKCKTAKVYVMRMIFAWINVDKAGVMAMACISATGTSTSAEAGGPHNPWKSAHLIS